MREMEQMRRTGKGLVVRRIVVFVWIWIVFESFGRLREFGALCVG